ncbi:MAG: TolC family protein, partial [Pacificimonas sp.]
MRCLTLVAAIAVAGFSVSSNAQETPLSLDDALARAGVADASASDIPSNPRLVGPQADSAAARALVGQARLRPNPEFAFDAENIAGSDSFSGLQATEYTLSVGQRLELGGKRGARVRAAEAEARVAELQGALAGADLGRSVRERYVEAVAEAARLDLARDIVERDKELARIAKLLVEVGREPPLRALRAEATLAESKAELQAAEATAAAAASGLAALWGDTGIPAVASDFPDIEPPAMLLAASDTA